MNRLSRNTFLALILTQAGHSTEEYFARLYAVPAPARFVSGLLFSNRRIGFVIFNVSLVAFGLWCHFSPVRHARRSATALAWFWVIRRTPVLVVAPSAAALARVIGRVHVASTERGVRGLA
jgi:hypothetical protein